LVIVALLWIVIIGEWKIALGSLIAILTFHNLITYLLLPPMFIFLTPSTLFTERGKLFFAKLFAYFYTLYIVVLNCVIALGAIYLFDCIFDGINLIPGLILCFFVVVTPWALLAEKEESSKDSTSISFLFTVGAMIIALILVAVGTDFNIIIIVYSLLMFFLETIKFFIISNDVLS